MNKIFLQYGIERTGTTLVFQIIRHVVKDRYAIRKAHDYKKDLINPSTVVLATCRDFRDVLVSLWRIYLKRERIGGQWNPMILSKEDRSSYINSNCGEINVKIDRSSIFKWADYINKTIRHIETYKRELQDRCEIIKYEDFRDNFEIIYQAIEKLTGLKIDDEQKKFCAENFNIKKNKDIAKKMKHFGEYDTVSLIHGDHIRKGIVGDWKNFVKPEDENYITEILRPSLEKWGYI